MLPKTKSLSLRPGYAALMLLVVVAIGLVIYFLLARTFFGPALKQGSILPASRPWLEEDRILPPDRIVDMPESPQPEITKDIKITAPVIRQGKDRGRIELTFDTQGGVTGTWSCQYGYDKEQYSYTSSFRGNIDISVKYAADGKTDKSRLYFITKGQYAQQSLNLETQKSNSQNGTIYVTGYLAGDYSAQGVITITTDKKWSATYDWQSK